MVQEESQHPPATAAVPRQHVPPQRHAQQQPPAPCTLRRPLSRRAKENICQESTVPPTSRREPRSFAHAAPDELSSWGATMPWWTDTRDLRGGVQGTKRAIGGASRSELAMNNGPFPEKWPRTMAHSNQWAKEMGHFPKNGLEQWPVSRRWQIGVTHVAQTARRLRQASRQQEPQPGSTMTCCIPRTCRLHPDATVVAIDYRPAVVGATYCQLQPWTRFPWWA